MYGGNSPTEEPVFLSSREYITKALALKERPIRMPEGLNEDQEENIRDIMLGIKMYTQIAQDERPYNKSWEPLRLEDWDTLKDIYQQLGEHASYLGLVHEATDEFRRWARRTGYIDEIERIIDSSENSPVNNYANGSANNYANGFDSGYPSQWADGVNGNTAPANGSQPSNSGTVETYSHENMDWGDGVAPSASSTTSSSSTTEEPLISNAEISVNFNASNSGSNGRQGEGVRKKRAKPTRRKRTRKPKPARKTNRKSARKPARKTKRKTTRKR